MSSANSSISNKDKKKDSIDEKEDGEAAFDAEFLEHFSFNKNYELKMIYNSLDPNGEQGFIILEDIEELVQTNTYKYLKSAEIIKIFQAIENSDKKILFSEFSNVISLIEQKLLEIQIENYNSKRQSLLSINSFSKIFTPQNDENIKTDFSCFLANIIHENVKIKVENCYNQIVDTKNFLLKCSNQFKKSETSRVCASFQEAAFFIDQVIAHTEACFEMIITENQKCFEENQQNILKIEQLLEETQKIDILIKENESLTLELNTIINELRNQEFENAKLITCLKRYQEIEIKLQLEQDRNANAAKELQRIKAKKQRLKDFIRSQNSKHTDDCAQESDGINNAKTEFEEINSEEIEQAKLIKNLQFHNSNLNSELKELKKDYESKCEEFEKITIEHEQNKQFLANLKEENINLHQRNKVLIDEVSDLKSLVLKKSNTSSYYGLVSPKSQKSKPAAKKMSRTSIDIEGDLKNIKRVMEEDSNRPLITEETDPISFGNSVIIDNNNDKSLVENSLFANDQNLQIKLSSFAKEDNTSKTLSLHQVENNSNPFIAFITPTHEKKPSASFQLQTSQTDLNRLTPRLDENILIEAEKNGDTPVSVNQIISPINSKKYVPPLKLNSSKKKIPCHHRKVHSIADINKLNTLLEVVKDNSPKSNFSKNNSKDVLPKKVVNNISSISSEFSKLPKIKEIMKKYEDQIDDYCSLVLLVKFSKMLSKSKLDGLLIVTKKAIYILDKSNNVWKTILLSEIIQIEASQADMFTLAIRDINGVYIFIETLKRTEIMLFVSQTNFESNKANLLINFYSNFKFNYNEQTKALQSTGKQKGVSKKKETISDMIDLEGIGLIVACLLSC